MRTRDEWFPFSQVKVKYLGNNQAEIDVPDWLARKKGLKEVKLVRESILEATRQGIDLGRDPTVEILEADFLEGFVVQELFNVRMYDEAKDPPRIAKFRKIVKTKSFGKVDGTPVDLFSASAVTQVYDALSKPANQRKYAKMDPVEMISIAYKLLQKGRKAAASRETSQAGAGVKNAMAQAVMGRGAPRKPLGDVGYAGTQEQVKGVRLYPSPDGKDTDVAIPEKFPRAKRAKVWSLLKKRFKVRKLSDVAGSVIGVKPDQVRKALGSMAEIAPVIGALARAAGTAAAGAIAKKVMSK